MRIISARKDFWSDNELAVSDGIRDVDLVGESPSVRVNEDDFLADIAEKTVIMLVHGCNNEPEDVHRAYAILEPRLLQLGRGPDLSAYDRVIGYIWPGGDDPLDYFSAKKRADALARRFGIWLQKMSDKDATVDLMGHSMGARVILGALKTRSSRVARNTIVMAASVDDESIQVDEEFYPSIQRTGNSIVFHSRHDPALKIWYRLAEGNGALGLSGPEDTDEVISAFNPSDPDTPNVFVVNCKNHIRGHGDYKEENAVYDHLDSFLRGAIVRQYLTL